MRYWSPVLAFDFNVAASSEVCLRFRHASQCETDSQKWELSMWKNSPAVQSCCISGVGWKRQFLFVIQRNFPLKPPLFVLRWHTILPSLRAAISSRIFCEGPRFFNKKRPVVLEGWNSIVSVLASKFLEEIYNIVPVTRWTLKKKVTVIKNCSLFHVSPLSLFAVLQTLVSS